MNPHAPRPQSEAIHFVGIGGIGMSAIARILLARGESISGSDLQDSALIAALRSGGARVTIGHKASNVRGARLVVVSSAIGEENVEYQAAAAAAIPILRRGQMLAKMMDGRRGIAVSGTHGKTTTTAMIACILHYAAVDASVVLGGEAIDTGTNARDGADTWFLTEADESDGSFMHLAPHIAVVTNIENDHIVSDAQMPQLVHAFSSFLAGVPEDGLSVVGLDSTGSASLLKGAPRRNVCSFGLHPAADWHPANIRFPAGGSEFELVANGGSLGTVRLHIPGKINVANALAAIAVARKLQISFTEITAALEAFSGVRRRFEVLARTQRMIVVDDYAHHPTAIRETIAAARSFHDGPLIAAFQPHRYTRTQYLAKDFARSLESADRVYLTPIYAAAESALDGVSERCIGEPLEAHGTEVRYVQRVEDLPCRLLQEAPYGGLVLMLGAGDISLIAAQLAGDVLRQAVTGV